MYHGPGPGRRGEERVTGEDEWRTEEWDVEVEDSGVYRLCKVNREWFLTGEYD